MDYEFSHLHSSDVTTFLTLIASTTSFGLYARIFLFIAIKVYLLTEGKTMSFKRHEDAHPLMRTIMTSLSEVKLHK